MLILKKRHLLELRNSLRRRGFWVDIVEGELVLDSWYSESNFYEMVSLLSSLDISVEAGDRGIRIISNSSISDNVLVQIETATRDESRGYSNEVSLPKLFRFDSINRLSIFELDYGIASLVHSLNKVGLPTSMSCDGHGRKDAKIWFNGEQMEEVRKLLEMATREISFAYDWEVSKERVGFILTGKKRLASDGWDVSKVQDDALGFSEFLLNT
jgi:hypothetical protein